MYKLKNRAWVPLIIRAYIILTTFYYVHMLCHQNAAGLINSGQTFEVNVNQTSPSQH